jgi:hypothetical protein
LKTDSTTGIKYPPDSINLSIGNEHGANVTVFASSNDGTSGYVSIYDKSITLKDSFNTSSNSSAARPSYTMFVPRMNEDVLDYFVYNNGTKNVESNYADVNSTSNNSDRLYAHTFKLPKGDYFISSPNGSANIYYVCAQGQGDQGNYGNQTNVFSTTNTIKNVDFIGRDPINTANYAFVDSDRLKVALQGTFSSASGNLEVTSGTQTKTEGIVSDSPLTITNPDNLLTLAIWNNNKYSMIFNGSTSKEEYISYTKS